MGKNGLGLSLAEMTYQLGYHSMADILRREYGFEAIDVLPYPRHTRGWSWQKLFGEAREARERALALGN